jgi:17beta-estradiol 17-dehydrogenase / very-long-chain 3-oxoacyl-CoA reductase
MDLTYWCWLLGLTVTAIKLWGLTKRLFFSNLDLSQFKYGWVAITGATDGIGKAIAQELHSQGYKVILIARNPEKLALTQAELLRSGPTEVETLTADFSISHRNPEEFYGELAGRLSAFEVSMLVNNVGVMDKDDFETEDINAIENMLAVNLYPMTFLSHALLPTFLQRFASTQQKSFILNISSAVAVKATPDMAVYAATKAYNDFLSRALSYEYAKAITVTSLTPAIVVSQMSKSYSIDGAVWGAVPASSYAKDSLKRLGARSTAGHWYHQLQLEVLSVLPQPVVNFMGRMMPKVNKSH